MSSTLVQSHLEANLNALGMVNREVIENLREVTPAEDIEFFDSEEGVPTARHEGRQLCSRRPFAEADRLLEGIDLMEQATVAVSGFGMGYHIQRLAERMKKAGVIIIYEPDLALVRAVLEEVDHSAWMQKASLIWVTDGEDRGELARKLEGLETILMQGLALLELPARRRALGESFGEFSETLRGHMTGATTTMMTALVRAVDTNRNFLLNLDQYAFGEGVSELKGIGEGHPAVVVAAGPSLQRNIHQLAKPGVRDRCVIIAVQTALKPLLEAGVTPHFITALDYHEISKRFYEELDPEAVKGITLVADPKVHPTVVRSWPGPIRCCSSEFLDRVLGEHAREMGALPAGATVAHLAMYLADFLGCDPIALIGQDLAFPDGLYYAPGTAIHRVWGPELNPFRTIAMMEWERIARMRVHLHKVKDGEGKTIYSDTQMVTYLQQFERDFAKLKERGVTIIDATEGGAAKQHTKSLPLEAFLDEHADHSLPAIPVPDIVLNRDQGEAIRRRLDEVIEEVTHIRRISIKTIALLDKMLEDQGNEPKMARHFKKMDQFRTDVEARFNAFELVNHLNQLGVFRRYKADRKIQLLEDSDPIVHQRAHLERDRDNVRWMIDAGEEMLRLLHDARLVIQGNTVEAKDGNLRQMGDEKESKKRPAATHIAALIPIDPKLNGRGIPRSLDASFGEVSVLQATLERLGKSETLKSIIVLAPKSWSLDDHVDCGRIGLPVEIEYFDDSPFGPEQAAFAVARQWSDTCWRGGIGGVSVYDEILCPQAMHEAMERRGLTAALVAGPDWPLIQVRSAGGCDAVVRRHLEKPDKHNIVFTQHPPGLGGCLISASLMEELAQRNRLSTVGGVLGFQPHAPQPDPIAKSMNVQVEAGVRHAQVRATVDSPRTNWAITSMMEQGDAHQDLSALDIVEGLQRVEETTPDLLPQHVQLELCTEWEAQGLFHRHPFARIERPFLSLDAARHLYSQLKEAGDIVLTLGGLGDPLLHPQWLEIVQAAKDEGLAGVHLRTALQCDRSTLDQLLSSGVDVISVDLHADRAANYKIMMGSDRFKEVLLNIEYLIQNRTPLTEISGNAAVALPWIVPRLERRAETLEDMESFYDRWVRMLGTGVIESPPPFDPRDDFPADTLLPAITPVEVAWHQLMRRMTVYADGSVPVSELDYPGHDCVGKIQDTPVSELWAELVKRRRQLRRDSAPDAEGLRLSRP